MVRPGQIERAIVYQLIAMETIDERMLTLARGKELILNRFQDTHGWYIWDN